MLTLGYHCPAGFSVFPAVTHSVCLSKNQSWGLELLFSSTHRDLRLGLVFWDSIMNNHYVFYFWHINIEETNEPDFNPKSWVTGRRQEEPVNRAGAFSLSRLGTASQLCFAPRVALELQSKQLGSSFSRTTRRPLCTS